MQPLTPERFRSAFEAVPALERDRWVDGVLGLRELPDDSPALPRDCVPYLPAPVSALAGLAKHVRPDDVVVDVGAGAGRAAAVLHLLTGARAVGIEVQPALAGAARELAARLALSRLSFIEGDAAVQGEVLSQGSVFFLYCPFSGARLAALLDLIAAVASRRQVLVGCVDLPLPRCEWLAAVESGAPELELFRSR